MQWSIPPSLLASHVWQSPVSNTESGGNWGKQRGKQAETEWKKGCRQHLYSAVFCPSKRPWKVLGGTKLQSLRCLWIRGVDRRESGQQGCSTESGWRYAGAFRCTERKVEGERFPFTQKVRNSLALRRSLVLLWGYFRCPSGVCPLCPPKYLTKDPEFPLDNKNLLPLSHRGGVHKRNAGACAPLKGDSSWPFTGGRAGKRAAIYSRPLCCGHGVF